MSRRPKPESFDSFPFTVPIVGLEPRESDAQTLIAVLSATEPAGQRSRAPSRTDRGPSPDALHRAQQRIDRVVATAAAGALILSIIFLREIAPSPFARTAWVLAVAWMALVLALASALGHHQLSQREMGAWIGGLDRSERGASRSGAWLPATASVSLVAGIACLAVFVFLNAGWT